MDIRFDGKRALVTGAGKGIGRDIAKALHQCGALTFGMARTKADLDSLASECPGIQTIVVDLSNWKDARAAVESVSPIDLLVNNAGTNREQAFVDIDEETFDMIFDINIKQVVNVSQVVAKGMIRKGSGGSIVNMSSQASRIAVPDHSVYSATKGALDALTRSMAFELGPHQIRVNSICPTIVLTDLGKYSWGKPEKGDPMKKRIPMNKFAEVKDVVHPVLYLLSDKSDMINGAQLPVDGGFTIC